MEGIRGFFSWLICFQQMYTPKKNPQNIDWKAKKDDRDLKDSGRIFAADSVEWPREFDQAPKN